KPRCACTSSATPPTTACAGSASPSCSCRPGPWPRRGSAPRGWSPSKSAPASAGCYKPFARSEPLVDGDRLGVEGVEGRLVLDDVRQLVEHGLHPRPVALQVGGEHLVPEQLLVAGAGSQSLPRRPPSALGVTGLETTASE